MQRSLSARLSFWIVLAAALLFVGLTVYLGRIWRTGVREEVDKDASQVLENAVLRLDDILDDVERTADVTSWFVLRDLEKPDRMVTYATNTLKYDAALNSCSISFEPWFYKAMGQYYSIFAWHDPDGSVDWEQEGDDDYRYFEKIWYQMPKQLGYGCWTEPYSDVADKPGMNADMLVSYCRPIFRNNSFFVGVVSLDLSLRRLSEELYDVKPYPNAYCILTGKDGNYLVHPDSGRLMFHSLFTDALDLSVPELQELGEAMGRQERGKRVITLDEQRFFVYFRPVPTTGWSIAIFCPENDILGPYNRMQSDMILIMLASLVLMFFLFVWLIRRQLEPLEELADEADTIASGQFDHPMDFKDRNDEIGLLSQSFEHMQASLVQHIRELTETTASRERMEKELQIARNIQMGMVPHDFNLGDSVDLYASMVPAREVGGDLYDFFVQDGRLYLCIGDVSGKGVPASLFMSVARAMFRIVARQGLHPAEIARRINDTVSEKNDQMIFVTMFIAAIDLGTGVMEYCNCGHNQPVLLMAGKEPQFLDCVPNTAVGIMTGFEFEGQQVKDMHEKVLFLYTDGLNEAENAAHEQFGNERMLAELGFVPFLDSLTTVNRLSAAVAAHVAGAEPSDDLTMLCLKLKSNNKRI